MLDYPYTILHDGDINNEGILNTLTSIAPVYVVRGNKDKEWAVDIPLFVAMVMMMCMRDPECFDRR